VYIAQTLVGSEPNVNVKNERSPDERRPQKRGLCSTNFAVIKDVRLRKKNSDDFVAILVC
jgi:hypothetical protein